VGSQPSFGEDVAGYSMVSNASESSAPDVVGVAPSSVGDPLTYSVSLDMQADAASSHDDNLSAASDEPRVLRLTEADMQEMASIEEASIGNAPPSDRDEEESLSEIGELAAFGGVHRFVGGDTTVSQDTTTTALESVSQISGHQSQRSARLGTSAVSSSSAENHDGDHASDHHSIIEGMPSASDPSHYLLSPGAASVAANPPSDRGRDDDVDDGSPLQNIDGTSFHDHGDDHISSRGSVDQHDGQLLSEENVTRLPELPIVSSGDSDRKDDDDGIANRSMLPGLVNRPRRHNPPANRSLDNSIELDGSPTRQHQGVVVDGFDFDKDAPRSPFLARAGGCDDSFRDFPADPWSPAGQMNVSPLHRGPRRDDSMDADTLNHRNGARDAQLPVPPFSYGAIEDIAGVASHLRKVPSEFSAYAVGRSSPRGEMSPLLAQSDDIPPEITTRRELSGSVSDPEAAHADINGHRHHDHGRASIMSTVDSVFSDLRSESELAKEEIHNESELYLASSMVHRGKCVAGVLALLPRHYARISQCLIFDSFPRTPTGSCGDYDPRNSSFANDHWWL
jgi:hypothetical protein